VVLPAALWGEKTGTYTNTDRTVHLSEQAVAPPGEARSDLEIWLDYARRMGFTDRSAGRCRAGRHLRRRSTPGENAPAADPATTPG
jgi:anaerobic selenocysteine-containing dehydrogenase